MTKLKSGRVSLGDFPGLGRAKDLSWSLGYASWGDSDPRLSLASDLSGETNPSLPLDQSWSVIFAACVLRGWRPKDEQASEKIGEFLPISEGIEGRRISNLAAVLEASLDPRLETSPPISGSRWPRVDPRGTLSWALGPEARDLVDLPDAIETIGRNLAAGSGSGAPAKVAAVPREDLGEFRSKSANALFTMFLAMSYARSDLTTAEAVDAYLDDIHLELREAVATDGRDEFQRSVIRKALQIPPGQFRQIIANAQQLYTNKANPLTKARRKPGV